MCHFVPATKQQSINPTTLVQFMSLTCHVPPWLVPGFRTRRGRRWATSKVPESKKNQRARSRQIVKRDLQYASILKFFVRSSCLVHHSPPNPLAQTLQVFFQGDLRYDLQAKRLELQVPEARVDFNGGKFKDQTTDLTWNVGMASILCWWIDINYTRVCMNLCTYTQFLSIYTNVWIYVHIDIHCIHSYLEEQIL